MLKNKKNKNMEKQNLSETNALTQYYRHQISRISLKHEGEAEIKIQDGEGYTETEWLMLNNESATELVRWLKRKFYYQRTLNF